MLEEGDVHQISLAILSNSTGLGASENRAKHPLQNKQKDKDLFIYPERHSLAITQESVPSHPRMNVLEMCFRSWVVGPVLCPQPQPTPRGSSLTGADQWGSAAPRAPPWRVSRIPLKFCKTLCVHVCARLRRDRAGRELALNVFSPFLWFPLLTSLGCSSTRPFAPETQPCSLLGWMTAPQTPRMSLPGPSPESVDHAVPRWIPRSFWLAIRSWWPSSMHKHCCVKPWQMDVVSPSCQLLVQTRFQPPKLGHGQGDETSEWPQCPAAPGEEPNHAHTYPMRGITGDCGLPSGCSGPAAHPSLDSATSLSLGCANPDDVGHVKMWLWNKWVSFVRVWP